MLHNSINFINSHKLLREKFNVSTYFYLVQIIILFSTKHFLFFRGTQASLLAASLLLRLQFQSSVASWSSSRSTPNNIVPILSWDQVCKVSSVLDAFARCNSPREDSCFGLGCFIGALIHMLPGDQYGGYLQIPRIAHQLESR